MDDSLFSPIVRRRHLPSEAEQVEAEPVDDLGSFSLLRGVRDRALMLELRWKDGRVRLWVARSRRIQSIRRHHAAFRKQ